LEDLDEQFKQHGGPGLLVFRGQPSRIFRMMKEQLGINKICYEQDCEPIWRKRDRDVELMCREHGIEAVEKVSHTLWNPRDIISANGGFAPLTYQMMLHTVNVLGPPTRPVNDVVDFSGVTFGRVPDHLYQAMGLLAKLSETEFLLNRFLNFSQISPTDSFA
jgi:cryptochrome